MSLLQEVVATVVEGLNQVQTDEIVPAIIPSVCTVTTAVYNVNVFGGVENTVYEVPLTVPIPAYSYIWYYIVDTSVTFTSPDAASLGIGINDPNDYLNQLLTNAIWQVNNPTGQYQWTQSNSTITSIKLKATNGTLTTGNTVIKLIFCA